MSSKLRQQKEVKVTEISDAIKNSSSVVVAEYRGLLVSELESLRRELKSQDVKIKVYKNRLFKISAKNEGYEQLAETLVGPNIFLFGGKDEIAPAKVLAKFAKKHKEVVFKGGIFENKVVSAEEMISISKLPSYEEALTILASSMMAPLRQIGVGLKMLIDENKLSN